MWKTIWRILVNESGQEPSAPEASTADENVASETTERATEDDSYGVRTPYDENTPDVAHSVDPNPEEPQTQDTQPPQAQEESFAQDLNLDPSTFTPEMKEIFKRMQAGYTKKMQKFKSYEGHLQNMERFYNDKAFAEQTLRSWAQQNGLSLVPNQFNNQPAANQPPAGMNPLQQKVVEALKSKLPQETQWMADGHGSAIFEVMKEVLGPVLQEFQGFKTAKEEHDWKTLEQQYEDTERQFAEKHPGWEAHEEDMSELLAFLNDQKAFSHPKYGAKHELLFKLVTGNANAVKEAQTRAAQAQQNKTPASTPRRVQKSGFNSIQDEVAATSDRHDAFAKAAQSALQGLKRRR